MPAADSLAPPSRRVSSVRHVVVSIETRRPLEFVDLTATLARVVEGMGLHEGLVTVHTRHTTTGLLINEHEPLLLQDLESLFERIAPASADYAHDDLTRRTVNLTPRERRNGHAHCRAALLRTSEHVPVAGGALSLGRWQRVFLVDFDGGQRREVSVTLMGDARPPASTDYS
jgi:secondary thiamine-phosphate synthase enzyme